MAQYKHSKLLGFIYSPLVIGLFFSLYSILIRLLVFQKYKTFLETDALLIQNFIEWFGTAYGLFIALVLVNVWSQFDTTEREFDREADAIFMLYQAAEEIKGQRQIKKKIINGIRDYITHVTKNYLVEHYVLKIRDQGDIMLEKIRKAIGDLVHTNEKTAIASELIREFNDVVDLRGDRISHSKQRIPNPVWGVALASSILWVAPFYALNFSNDLIAIILEGGVTAIVVAILIIIKDLDDPFEGTWRIKITEWELLGEKIGIKPTLIFVYSFGSSRIYKVLAFVNRFFSHKLCVLYSLLTLPNQQKEFLAKLEELAYLQIYYKDQFESIYEEEAFPLPVILYKSGYTMKPIIGKEKLNDIVSLDDLRELIIKEVMNFRKSKNGNL